MNPEADTVVGSIHVQSGLRSVTRLAPGPGTASALSIRRA
jgi:hypothetical protein